MAKYRLQVAQLWQRDRASSAISRKGGCGETDNHSLKGFSQESPLPLTDPHHMVIKPFVPLGLLKQISTLGVIDIAADHQMFMTFTGELS